MTVEPQWTQMAADVLVGRKIKTVSYMTTDEARSMGWFGRPLVIRLDDESEIIAMSDDEGNDGGALMFVLSRAVEPPKWWPDSREGTITFGRLRV